MKKSFRALLAAGLGVLGTVAASPMQAQTTTPAPSPLMKQIQKMDLGLGGAYMNASTVKGTNYLNQSVTQATSSTFGALLQLRYTKSKLIGVEGNYGYGRYTQSFSSPSPTPNLSIQANAHEVTLGWLVHGPVFSGFQTFASAGAGTTAFVPTRYGGEGFHTQGRATYFFSFGAENPIFTDKLGIRVQFRENFHLAPDFGQNYLTVKKISTTIEPAIGFYVHF